MARPACGSAQRAEPACSHTATAPQPGKQHQTRRCAAAVYATPGMHRDACVRAGSAPFSRFLTLRLVSVMRMRWTLAEPSSSICFDLAAAASACVEDRECVTAQRWCQTWVCRRQAALLSGPRGSVRWLYLSGSGRHDDGRKRRTAAHIRRTCTVKRNTQHAERQRAQAQSRGSRAALLTRVCVVQ